MNALLECWRAVETGKRPFFLLTVINNHATITSATKMDKRKMLLGLVGGILSVHEYIRPVCLVCGASLVLTKEYINSIRGHYQTKHHEKYKDLDVKRTLQKAQEIKRSVVSQQTIFMKAKLQSKAAVKANFLVAAEIEKSSRPLNEGELVKKCMFKVCDIVCPDKKQDFLNVSVSRTSLLSACISFPLIYINS